MAIAADSKKAYIPISTIYGKPNADGTYTLNALDVKNLNDNLWSIVNKIQGNLTLSDISSLAIDELRSTVVITNNLYATYGDIAELTVDRLLTADKVDKYKDGDTSEINYIWIQDKSIKFMTGAVILNGTTPTTQQHTDRNGNLLYWKDSSKLAMCTDVTVYPVIVYAYNEMCKAAFDFRLDSESGYYVPKITLGAGTGISVNDTLTIYKPPNKALFEYVTPAGVRSFVEMSDFVDIKGRRLQSCYIDKTNSTITVTQEGATTSEVITYVEGTNSITYTFPDNFTTTVSIS